MKTLMTFGLIAGVVMAFPVRAQVGVTGDVGTTGVGAHVSIPIRPGLQMRIGAGYLTYNYHGTTRFLDYDLKLKGNTANALLDWFPVRNSGFRVTAGVAYIGNKIDAHAKPNLGGFYSLQNSFYKVLNVGSISGTTEFPKTAPYLGIGWGTPLSNAGGWTFSTDLGVLFQGTPSTTLTSSGCSMPGALCAMLLRDLQKEAGDLNEEIDNHRAYPVLRLGIGYAF